MARLVDVREADEAFLKILMLSLIACTLICAGILAYGIMQFEEQPSSLMLADVGK